jgi:hypothetical protein
VCAGRKKKSGFAVHLNAAYFLTDLTGVLKTLLRALVSFRIARSLRKGGNNE